MRSLNSLSWAAMLFCLVAGCSTMDTCYEEGASPETLRTVYVIQRGWHTGVAVAKHDWPNREWSLLNDFPESNYLEFGWGDARFYQAERNTFWLGVRAALWPTASVIHVIGLNDPISNAYAEAIVPVRVSHDGLRALTEAVEHEFTAEHPVPTGSPLRAAPHPNRFYDAKRSFYFPRMCNWWIAARLKEAGCPIQPWSVITASRVIREARGFAREPAASQARSYPTSGL
jgi:uncharacterized protein (TIGR02117 family)